MTTRLYLLIVIVSVISAVACVGKSTSRPKPKATPTPGATPSTTPTPGATATPYYTPTPVPTTGKLPYYCSGNGYDNAISHFLPTSSVNWSSKTSISNQNILITDSRFDVRVVALDLPARNTTYTDPTGQTQTCLYNNYSYRTLSGTVIIKATVGGPALGTFSFSKVPIGWASSVGKMTVPATSTPLIMEVKSIKSDMACMQYCESVRLYCPQNAYGQYNCAGCQYASAQAACTQYGSCCSDQTSSQCTNCINIDMPKDCFQLDVQFSTDYTEQFPSCQCYTPTPSSPCPTGCWR